MEKNSYEDLQALTKRYGEETQTFYKNVKDVGPKVLEAYRDFLGGPPASVNGVPPVGTFVPRTLYRGEAFSSHDQRTLYLEPIFMGVCTEIGNLSDGGATWVRTVLEFRPSGAGLVIFVGERARKFSVGPELPNMMDAVCDAILEDVREAFTLELDEAKGHARIGFITPKE